LKKVRVAETESPEKGFIKTENRIFKLSASSKGHWTLLSMGPVPLGTRPMQGYLA